MSRRRGVGKRERRAGPGRTRQKLTWQWRLWYSQYLKPPEEGGGQFPHEAGEEFIILFKALIKHYPAQYYSSDLVRVERGGVYEEFYTWFDEKGKLGEAAQEVIVNTIKAWLRSERFRKENFKPEEWTDKQIHFYVRRVMEREIKRIRHKRSPTAWWWMYGLMEKVAKRDLQCINQFKQLYVPEKWGKTGIPDEKHFHELEAALDSVPRWRGEIPERLGIDVLYTQVVRRMFDQVEAPIPLGDLVTHALRIFGISPSHPAPLEWGEQSLEDKHERTKGGTIHEKDLADSSGESNIATVELDEWVQIAISYLTAQHLLVIYLRACKGLEPEKVARLVRQILEIRRFRKTTVENRLKQAGHLFRRGLGRGTKFVLPGLPTTPIDQEAFFERLCSRVNLKLWKMGYGDEIKDAHYMEFREVS